MRAHPSRALLALLVAAGFAVAPAFAADAPAAAASQPANAVRPEFGKPYNAAAELIKGGKNDDAMAKLKEAEAVPNQTPYETYLALHLRAVIEYAANDIPNAEKDFERLMGSDLLPAADRASTIQTLGEMYYRDQKYAQAAQWMQRYFDAGGNDPQERELYAQSLYLAKDYPAAAKAIKTNVDAQTAAGKTPDEKTLRMLASAQSNATDDESYAKTLERLAVYYPKSEQAHDYWLDVIQRVSEVEHMPDRLYLDYSRLKAAALGRVADSERLTYASLAMRNGYPLEAKKLLDDGLARKAFASGEVAEATKLRDQAAHSGAQDKAQQANNEALSKSAKDGNGLVGAGLFAALDGDGAHGADLIQQGIAKGGLKNPDEARLHLGLAQFYAGNYADANKTFSAINAPGSLGALAHAWALLSQSRLQPVAATAPVAAASAAK